MYKPTRLRHKDMGMIWPRSSGLQTAVRFYKSELNSYDIMDKGGVGYWFELVL